MSKKTQLQMVCLSVASNNAPEVSTVTLMIAHSDDDASPNAVLGTATHAGRVVFDVATGSDLASSFVPGESYIVGISPVG